MRPVFLYEPDCGMHLDPVLQFGCRWCCIEKQPMLCIRCGDKRKLAEEQDDRVNRDFALMNQIVETNARHDERRRRDSEQVSGIAKASGMESPDA